MSRAPARWIPASPGLLEVERSVIGIVLQRNEALGETNGLPPSSFYDQKNQEIWLAVRELEARRQPIDILTLQTELERVGKFAAIGFPYLVELLDVRGHEGFLATYVELIETAARQRRAVLAISEALELAKQPGVDPTEVMPRLRALADKLEAPAAGSPLPVRADDMVLTVWAQPIPAATKTGLAALDAVTGGLRAESFAMLNGPPARGKTGLAIQISRYICGNGARPLVYITTELSKRQVLARFAAQERNTPWGALYDTGPSEALAIAGDIAHLELYPIEFSRGLDLLALLDGVAQKLGAAPVLVLDYLQHAARGGSLDDRRLAVAALTDLVGSWCRATRSTALLVGATSRVQYGSDETRSPSDFLGSAKESGDPDYDAAIILFLETDGDTAKLHVAKNRFGVDSRTIGLKFNGAVGTFREDPLAGLSELERKVLVAIRHGATSGNSVLEKTGGKRKAVQSAVKALVQKQLIDRMPLRVIGAAVGFTDEEDFDV